MLHMVPHDPEVQAGRIRFHRACFMVMLLVSSGSPESRTQHHPVISRVWATGPRLPFANVVADQVGMAGLEPASPCSQSTWVRRYPTSRLLSQSKRADLNRRSPGPRPGAITRLRYVLFACASSDPYRSRTGLPALKGRRPQTDRRTGPSRRHIFHAVDSRELRAPFTQWVGRCSNPRLRLFRPPLHHLSYRPNKKSPMSL